MHKPTWIQLSLVKLKQCNLICRPSPKPRIRRRQLQSLQDDITENNAAVDISNKARIIQNSQFISPTYINTDLYSSGSHK